MTLVGFHQVASWFSRLSPVASWVEHNLCALSESREGFSFCPPLVCPHDARLIGYPWALLPNGTASVLGIRGFMPVRATQWPPPGTPLWRNTTTNVTITAFDASERTFECIWHVHVPPLVELGYTTFKLPSFPNGTIQKSSSLRLRGFTFKTGRIYKMSGITADRIKSQGTRLNGGLHKSGKLTGAILRLLQNRTKGAIAVPKVKVEYSLSQPELGDESDSHLDVPVNATSDVKVHVELSRNANANNVTYRVYGQILTFAGL
jgi:hypothetical protein